MRTSIRDTTQQAFNWLIPQLSYVEAQVYRTKYADITYRQLVPVETAGDPWAKSFTYFSINTVGNADWYDGMADDIPLADINRNKFEQGIEMAAIGYRYNLEEIGQSMMLNINITDEKAQAARRASEEFLERIAFVGDARKEMTGLINNPLVTRTDAIADGSGSSATWASKTADQINRDVNSQLTQVNAGTLGVEMADTILLPLAQLNTLANTRLANTGISGLEFLSKNNVYTYTTGAPLTIRGTIWLTTAGSGGTARMVAYRKDPQVVKLNIPMPHHFEPVFQRGPATFDIPGWLRVGGVQIRRPASFSYLDGI